MEILLVSKSRGHFGRLRLSWTGLIISTVFVVALMGWLIFSSYRHGVQETRLTLQQPVEIDVELIYQQLAEQEKRIKRATEDAKLNLDALALRLGRLQAMNTRMESLGQRLVEQTGLSADEFDFARIPATGGPAPEGKARTIAVDDFIHNLEQLELKQQQRQELLEVLDSLLLRQQQQQQSLPSGWPVASGYMSSGFGKRPDPKTGKQDFHRGLDFAGSIGTQVIAVASGVVTFYGRKSGYGNIVEIDHGEGYVTRYAHNRENLVQVGSVVSKGQQIALLGATGRVTGPHVHYEVVKDGKIVNPLPYVKSATR